MKNSRWVDLAPAFQHAVECVKCLRTQTNNKRLTRSGMGSSVWWCFVSVRCWVCWTPEQPPEHPNEWDLLAVARGCPFEDVSFQHAVECVKHLSTQMNNETYRQWHGSSVWGRFRAVSIVSSEGRSCLRLALIPVIFLVVCLVQVIGKRNMWHKGSGNGWGTRIASTTRHEIQAINNGIYHVMITRHVTQSLSGIVHVTTVMPEQNALSGIAT